MKKYVAFAFVAFAALPGASPASAASPAYCALYAREYASSRVGAASGEQAATALQRLGDQAYFRCLNLDYEPEFPETSAYFDAPVEDIIGTIGTDEEIDQGDAAGDIPDEPVDTVPVIAKPAVAKPKPVKTASTGGGSKLKPWSDEWVVWCKAHYRSFNETTGMVLTFSGEKKMCP